MRIGVPVRIGGNRRALDVERDVELLQVGPELRDVVAVDQVVGVRVEQVDRRPGEDERDLVFAGDHAQPDAHRLVGAMRGARILRDDEDDRLGVGHGVN